VQLSDKGPEILLRQNFWGPEILEFPAPMIFRKSLISCCGATIWKGAGISGRKFHFGISGGRNFRPQAGISEVSFLQRADFKLAYK
jgi:hypothetical protein